MAYKRKRDPKIKSTKTKVNYKGKILLIDSKMEAKEAMNLISLERGNVIQNLQFQPKFELLPSFNVRTNKTKNGKSKQSAMTYTPDFSYTHGLEKVIIEVKGFATKDYLMRRKLFLYIMDEYDIDVFIEVGSTYRHEYRKVT